MSTMVNKMVNKMEGRGGGPSYGPPRKRRARPSRGGAASAPRPQSIRWTLLARRYLDSLYTGRREGEQASYSIKRHTQQSPPPLPVALTPMPTPQCLCLISRHRASRNASRSARIILHYKYVIVVAALPGGLHRGKCYVRTYRTLHTVSRTRAARAQIALSQFSSSSRCRQLGAAPIGCTCKKSWVEKKGGSSKLPCRQAGRLPESPSLSCSPPCRPSR